VANAVENAPEGDITGTREVWPFAFLTTILFVLGLVPVLVLGPARPVLERLLSR